MKAWSAPGMDKATFREAMGKLKGDQAETFKKGLVFGPSWSDHWVQVSLKISDEFGKAGQQVLCKLISAPGTPFEPKLIVLYS